MMRSNRAMRKVKGGPSSTILCHLAAPETQLCQAPLTAAREKEECELWADQNCMPEPADPRKISQTTSDPVSLRASLSEHRLCTCCRPNRSGGVRVKGQGQTCGVAKDRADGGDVHDGLIAAHISEAALVPVTESLEARNGLPGRPLALGQQLGHVLALLLCHLQSVFDIRKSFASKCTITLHPTVRVSVTIQKQRHALSGIANAGECWKVECALKGGQKMDLMVSHRVLRSRQKTAAPRLLTVTSTQDVSFN